MRSPRGFAAAVAFLAALPLAALYQVVMSGNPAFMLHVVLGVGAALMAVAVFDFRTPRWVAWTGCVSLSVLASIFLLQAVSELARNESLTDFAYRVMGQRLEASAGDLFVAWCIVALVRDSQGWRRLLGAGAIVLVVAMRTYAYYLSFQDRSLSVEAPALIAMALLPFVWLIFETTRSLPASGSLADGQ
jgi:membrane protein YdbS with pleckstrin-like domain